MTDLRRNTLRALTDAMLEFAGTLSASSAGHLSPRDVADLLIGTGTVLLTNELGRESVAHQLRELASRVEAGATPAELN
jgi:hypothetical protein